MRAPVLERARHMGAGLLSGGQQRLLEIERLWMGRPRLILVDEPSVGLAPRLVDELFHRLALFQEEGVSILLADQNVRRVVEISKYVYVLQLGAVIVEGPREHVLPNLNEIVQKFI
jgi:branched-chain amino acid transport system ATP-binding protein